MNASLPANWTVEPLGDLAHVYSGGTPSRAVPAYWGGDIPWITTTEIEGGYVVSARETITDAGLNASAARIARPGTLLLAMYGQGKTRGKVAMLGISAAMNQACAAVEAGSRLNPRFLLYYLSLKYEDIRSMSNAGNQENLSGELVRRIPIAVPPIGEQRKIADVLGDSDDAISTLKQMIAKRQTIKQGMMQQLLTGNTRLSGFTDRWAEVYLGEAGTLTGSGVDKKINAGEPSVRLLNYMDVYKAEFVYTDTATQVVTAPIDKVTKCSIRASDVFFTPTSETPDDIARSAVAMCDVPGTAYSYHLVRWRPSGGWDPAYLGNAFATDAFRRQASTLASGSGTRYVISIPGFRNLKVLRPPVEEQHAIGACLRDASAEIEALRVRLAKARDVKQGMMQELLSGRTRLPVREVAA